MNLEVKGGVSVSETSYLESINPETVTVGDLLDKYELKRETVVIHNGKVEE